jgi:chaperonin cofactor prefoldin
VAKLMEVEDEKRENELVLESISKLEDDRKCWRLVNGVLMEKTKVEVVPEMRVVINNLNMVGKQIQDTLVAVKTEIKNLEGAYEHIMANAKKNAAASASAGENQSSDKSKQGGVLV